MTDRYTKFVLTVIAVALLAQLGARAITPSKAQYATYCAADIPCPVYMVYREQGADRWRPCYQNMGACHPTK